MKQIRFRYNQDKIKNWINTLLNMKEKSCGIKSIETQIMENRKGKILEVKLQET